MTRSLNGFYYKHFERLLIDLRSRHGSTDPYQLSFKAELESRNQFLYSITVHVKLVKASDEVLADFETLFLEEKVKVPKEQSGGGDFESVYTINEDGGFTGKFFHNPTGQAAIREDPNSQYVPGPEADAEFNKTAEDLERELRAEMEALKLEVSEGNSEVKIKAKKSRSDK
jgi:hypothetical protein